MGLGLSRLWMPTSEYENSGPDTGSIFLEFDDSSQGSCEITLAFSSLTAGSFTDECFDAGVNTNVPFDRSFRMPRLAPRSEDDLDPPTDELGVPRAPRTSEEFDALVVGRDDFIPGLFFGRLCVYCSSGGIEGGPGWASRIEIDSGGNIKEFPGMYTYRNSGTSEGVITFEGNDGNTYVFTLDFEPSGNVRVTTTDPDGNDAVWPGSLHVDSTLGAQPILLPIPPSWSAAIAIEADIAPEDEYDAYGLVRGSCAGFTQPLMCALFGDLWDRRFLVGPDGVGTLALVHDHTYRKIGHNRGTVTIWWDLWANFSESDLSQFQQELLGSTWVFDLTFTSDGAAKFTLTITKEGFLPTVVEGFVDFTGDGINVDEFPEELLIPDEPPQASGEDRSGVEVAAAVSTRRIGPNDVQTFLVNNPGLQPAAYSPGDWLEPKDGGYQRMMIVGASPVSAARITDSLPVVSPQLRPDLVKVQSTNSPHASPIFSVAVALLGRQAGPPVFSNSNSAITQLSVVCMQQDHDIPTRGARYFSRPKSAHSGVQWCQRDCVLDESDNLQLCVWRCERSPEGN